jgi:spore coat protein SA
MIYHLLTESEPFSEHAGGALSRWTANVLREDDNSMVVCPWADPSWDFAPSRIWQLPGLCEHSKYFQRLRYHTALRFRVLQLKYLFRPLVARLRQGDVIYIHNRPEFALALRSSCVRKQASLVLHMQNSHLRFVPQHFGKKLSLDAIVFCSAYLQHEKLEFTVKTAKSEVIPNGADESCFFPTTEIASTTAGPVVLFVGRLIPEKGVHVFVDAMRILQRNGVASIGRIVGSPGFGTREPSQYVERLKQNAPSNVEFVNYVSGPALANEFRKAHIFCCPSTWNEPFGMVNVEAMATALPVVATAVGGIPEIFSDGGGILIPNNSPGDLAAAVESLVIDANKCHQLSWESYRTFQKRYRWQHIRSQYQNLVGSLTRPSSEDERVVVRRPRYPVQAD